MKVQDSAFSSVMTLLITNACMRKAIVSRYRAAWNIRGNLSEIAIMHLHQLLAEFHRCLLLVLSCLRRLPAGLRLHLLLIFTHHR